MSANLKFDLKSNTSAVSPTVRLTQQNRRDLRAEGFRLYFINDGCDFSDLPQYLEGEMMELVRMGWLDAHQYHYQRDRTAAKLRCIQECRHG